MIEQRIFIVGAPRSGTTLLQGMLAAHPRIESFPETHFFSMAYPRNRLKRLLTWPALNVQGVLERFLREIGRPDLIPEVKIGLFDRHYERSFIRVLDRLTLEAGKDIWVEKTPRHLHFIPEIQKRVPGAKFIHIVRDGKDVVASLYEVTHKKPMEWAKGRVQGFQGFTVEECVRRWNQDVLITSQYVMKPEHHIVRYEELVESPESSLMKICQFLHLNYVPQMVYSKQTYEQIVTPDESWKENVARAPQKMPGKFTRVFDERQQKYILDSLITVDF